jgi:hypothetical protein
MPSLVGKLAAADHPGTRVYPVGYTAPGWRLSQFARDSRLPRLLLDVHWDAVVLQEASYIREYAASYRAKTMDPPARTLDREIRGAGSRTVLYMTWGYRHGDGSAVPDDTYEAMQDRVTWNYEDLARKLDAGHAPVGLAWREALRRDRTLGLWDGDGRHPSRAGSYLAACVFYAYLTGEETKGNPFTDGLPRREALLLQRAADSVT